MSYLRYSCCSICVKRLDKVKKNNIRQVTEKSLATYGRFWSNIHLEIGDKICGKCKSKYDNYLANQKKVQSHDNHLIEITTNEAKNKGNFYDENIIERKKLV